MMTTATRPHSPPIWEPELEFEHIPWGDIVEAEQQGDMETLNSLRDRSLEIRKSRRYPDGYHSPVTPTASHTTPISGPGAGAFKELNEDYPYLPSHSNDTPSLESPFQALSYAQALEPRLTKRTMEDRTCLSPIDYLPKRSAFSKAPTDVGPSRSLSPATTTKIEADMMEIEATPDSDSRPNKASIAAQRRLFPPSVDKVDPTEVLRSERRPRSSSVSSGSGKEVLSGHQITQRTKQIDYGKNTTGYQRYIQTVPKWKRTRDNPWTPDKSKSCSTRSWQGQIRVWRRALHEYDPPTESGSQFTAEEAALCLMDFVKE